jgi:hypothetical protein
MHCAAALPTPTSHRTTRKHSHLLSAHNQPTLSSVLSLSTGISTTKDRWASRAHARSPAVKTPLIRSYTASTTSPTLSGLHRSLSVQASLELFRFGIDTVSSSRRRDQNKSFDSQGSSDHSQPHFNNAPNDEKSRLCSSISRHSDFCIAGGINHTFAIISRRICNSA